MKTTCSGKYVLGIGANTAVFSAVNGLFLKTLPVRDPETLVRLKHSGPMYIATRTSDWGYSEKDAAGRQLHANFSYRAYQDFLRGNRTLEDMLASAPAARMTVTVDGHAEIPSALLVSGNFFAVLGVQAALGRTINPDDDRPSAAPVAMISHGYWNRRFGADPDVLGKTVTAYNTPITIVGITPKDFIGVRRVATEAPDIVLPLSLDAQLGGGARLGDADYWWLFVMGRLKPGVTPAQVRANLEAVLQEAAPRRSADPEAIPRLHVDSGSRGIYDTEPDAARTMKILGVTVGLVLMIVCANVANLLLSRASARQREISVRLSLGATRLRLIRQLLTESVLLALSGGAVGIGVGYWTRDLLPEAAGAPASFDWHIFLFVAALSVIAGIAFGLVPALRATRASLSASLNENSRHISPSRSVLTKSLILIQVAVSVVLLVGAGLLIRTLQNLRHVEVGFNPQNLLLFHLDPMLNRYDTTRTALLYDRIALELEALPGVRSVSLSQIRFLSSDTQTTGIRIPGDEKPWNHADSVYLFGVAPNFFETMQIPLIAGREFTGGDNNPGAPTLAIFNESAARKFFAGQDPVGRRFLWNTFGPDRKILQRDIEIAGVVQDAKHASVRDSAPPMIYLPYLQLGIRGMTFVVRTERDPVRLIPSVREAVRRIDPNLPLIDMTTQIEQMETRFAEERFFAFSYSLVGVLALIVASIGYLESCRTTSACGPMRWEFGWRSARSGST